MSRVPTEENIADCPSRHSYDLLEKMGAEWIEPKLDPAFLKKESWDEVLHACGEAIATLV